MAHRDLAVLDAAQQAADQINALIDRAPRGHLLHVAQMRDSAQSTGANIKEAFGRRKGPARNHALEIARAEAEETIEHLRANYRAERLTRREYWPLRNRLVVVAKMLTRLLYS